MSEPTHPDPAAVLCDVFGFPAFREGQEAVIGRVLDGRSSLAIFPTGGGKSLCYQVPALLLDGLTVVVSPLIALMKDQVDALKRRGVAAARLDSSLEGDEARAVYRDIRSGRLRLLYVAPERLANERFVQLLAGRPIALLAIDEAHCISEWGHNFRPEYLKLATLARTLAVGRVLAMTATATPSVAADVARAFAIDDEDIIRTGFHRPNLDLYATACRPEERRSILLDRLRSRSPEPAIVYVTLQRTAEELAAFLGEQGVDAVAYHAGLKAEERDAIQNAFMASDAQVIVATIAFGMGIDKADIRAIYHYNLPKGPENYAQEVGRAGRDGHLARCELLASPDDVVTLENFAYGDTPTPEAVGSLLDDVLGRGDVFDVSTYELSGEHDIRPLVVRTLLTYLELEGVIEATGPFYGTYKLQFLRPVDAIAGRFDRGRADFLLRLFATAKAGRTWHTIDLGAAVEELGEPRDRIIKALNYLEEQGDLVIQVADARIGYRTTSSTADADRLGASLIERFRSSEEREIGRIGRMLGYATEPGCLSRWLLRYFDEDLSADCGHCGRCRGEPPRPLPERPAWSPSKRDHDLIAGLITEGHEALGTPRQVARFLCGLASPASTKARLKGDRRFGTFAEAPFAAVLEAVERAGGGR